MNNFVFLFQPISWFLIAAIIYFVGIQQDGHKRRVSAFLHTVAISLCFASRSQHVWQLPVELVAFLMGWTVHSSGVLLFDGKIPGLGTLTFIERLKTSILVWNDLRGIQRNHGMARVSNIEVKHRFNFAMKKLIRASIFFSVNHALNKHVIPPLLDELAIILHDFSPSKQGLLPALEKEDLILRSIVSTQWIWKTFFLLTAWHDLFAVLFVSILRWSDKSDWPPLYGSLSEAYSLRRFWGIFWHRLHIAPFAGFTPSVISYRSDTSTRSAAIKKALRPLWIFLLSAACHGVVNLVVYRQAHLAAEIRFFMCNWVVCLVETLIGHVTKKWETRQRAAIGMGRRICGYVFVFFFFFCTVPAWRYPLVYDSAASQWK